MDAEDVCEVCRGAKLEKAVRREELESCAKGRRITDLPESGASALGEACLLKLRPKAIGET